MEHDSPKAFSRRLKEAMARADLSNGELAEALGVNPVTVSNWRTGEFIPDDRRLLKLAAKLGVDRRWLRYGEESANVMIGESFRVGEPLATYGYDPASFAAGQFSVIEKIATDLAGVARSAREQLQGGRPAPITPREADAGHEDLARVAKAPARRRKKAG